jgi:hypothetical protein
VTVVKSQMSNFSAISWQEQVTINEMMKMKNLMISFAPYFTITVLNFVVPKVCWRLTIYESYLHETEIRMSVTR